jgi:hypothetical protein
VMPQPSQDSRATVEHGERRGKPARERASAAVAVNTTGLLRTGIRPA